MDAGELRRFYEAVLPREGWYVIARREKQGFRHVHLKSLDELCRISLSLRDKPGSYFATQAYREATNRKGDNVRSHKTLRCDVDIRPGGTSYSTVEAAISALSALDSDYGTPLTVWSGGGFHLYWPLSREVEPDEWIWLAAGLKERCIALGLLIDHGCTADRSRVLRIPGAINEKWNTRVEVIQWHERELDPDALPRGQAQAFKPLAAVAPIPPAPADIEALAVRCGQIALFLAAPEDQPEPAWKNCGRMFCHIDGGREAFHAISSRHPGYASGEAESKLNPSVGVPHCATFETDWPEGCEGCKYRHLNLTPLKVAAVPDPEPAPQLPAALALPNGYQLANDGALYYTAAKGVPVRICNGLVAVDSILEDEDGREGLLRLRYSRHGKAAQYLTLPMASLVNHLGVRTLAAYGISVACTPAQWHQYFTASHHQVALAGPETKPMAVKTLKSMGWKKPSNSMDDKYFVLGPTAYSPSHPPVQVHADENSPYKRISREYHVRGSADDWRSVMQAYLLDDTVPEGAKVTWFAGIATPLIRRSGQKLFNSGVHVLVGPPGTGKTTLLVLSASCWGNPSERGDQFIAPRSTMNSVCSHMAVLKHLPVYVDEADTVLFGNSADEMGEFIHIINGREKGRMAADGGMREAGQWELNMICASNQAFMPRISSKLDADSATGNLARIVEYTLPAAASGRWDDAGYMEFAKSCYGHFGAMWIPHILSHDIPAIYRDEFNRDLGFDRADRIYRAHAALTFTAMKLLKGMGWTVDKRLYDFQIEHLRKLGGQQKEMRQKAGYTAMLQQFMHANRSLLLTYSRMPTAQAGCMPEEVAADIFVKRQAKGALILEKGLCLIEQTAAQQYLKMSGVASPRAILSALIAKGDIWEEKIKLYGYNDRMYPPTPCYAVPVNSEADRRA